jgi:hypothetical protein
MRIPDERSTACIPEEYGLAGGKGSRAITSVVAEAFVCAGKNACATKIELKAGLSS